MIESGYPLVPLLKMGAETMKRLGVLTATSCTILFILNTPSSFAAPTKRLVFAYIKDAPPVSYENGTSILDGYCGSLRSHLTNQGWNIEDISITYPERFKMLASKRFDIAANLLPAIECGPSTITKQRKDQLSSLARGDMAWFSNPFFTTSTKILVNKKNLADLYKNPGVLTIGVQGATTNQVIEKIFPTASIVTVKSRADAVDRLTTNDASRRINAYTGDEVILIDLMKENTKGLGDRFLIEPKLYGYTHEQYGIVIYNDKDLRDFVNSWIDGDGQEARKLLNNKHFVDSWSESIVRTGYFYLIIKLFSLVLLVLLLTNPVFLALIYNMLPFKIKKKLLTWLRDKQKRKTMNPIANLANAVLNNRFTSVREFEVLLIVRELGFRPLFNEYLSEGLSSDQAIDKLSRNLREIEERDSVLSKILSKWLDESGSQGVETLNNKLIEWFRS
jgi:ABC-type amino acid transport substrate-binding protein